MFASATRAVARRRCGLLGLFVALAMSPLVAFAQARVNLAKFQHATASAQSVSYAYDPEFAVDGTVSNFSSYRTGNRTASWWLQVTYQEPITLASAHVYLGIVGATNSQVLGSFVLQSSDDGVVWTAVPGATVTGNTQLERAIVFTQPVTASRFRLFSSQTGSFTIRELAFFPPNVVGEIEQGYPLGTDVRFNLAYLRPATASSAALTNPNGPGYAKNAFDGYIDNASRWVLASTAAAGEWIEVELGDLPKRTDPAASTTADPFPTQVYLGGAHIYSGGLDANRVLSSPLTDFKLQSWDATNYQWVDIPGATVVGNTQTALAITFTQPVATSNVRLVTTAASPARLHELLLFPPSTVTGVDLSLSPVTGLGREVANTALPAYRFTGYSSSLPVYANVWDTYSDSNYYLNSVSSGLRLALINGQVVFAPTSNNTTAQTEWQLLMNIRDGSYRIRNTSSGLCLGQASVTTAAGTSVVAQTYSALPTQDWRLVPDSVTPTRLTLVNVYSGLALQSVANSTTAGAAMMVDTVTSGRAVQQWTTQFVRPYPKKGIAGTNNPTSYPSGTPPTTGGLSFQQDFFNRLGGSWSYSWGRQTSDAFPFHGTNFTFNPMQWGNGNNNFWVTSSTPGQGPIERNFVDFQANPKPMHLMGYNEPDHTDQANVLVPDAIARWPRLEALQAPLVGPCPADPDGPWQNDFYAQANALGYRRDYTPVHVYPSPSASGVINTLQAIYNTYQRPIWLTEFSFISWNGTGSWTDGDNFHALAEFMWRAESLSWLKRYSLFVFSEGSTTGTDPSNAPRSNALRADGSLTAFGQLYAGWDAVTSVVNHRAYHLHNRTYYHRIRNPGGTANPGTLNPETADAGVQWFLAPGTTSNTRRIISTRDGRPLQSNGTTVTFGAIGQTDTAVEWRVTAADSTGLFYLEHVAAGKRLNNANGSLTMVANTTTSNDARWRLVAPAVADSLTAPVITSSLTASGTVDGTFSYQITANTFASSYSASGLPAGLSLNSTTGLISGTPTIAGQYSVSLSATNYIGTGSTVVLSLSVAKGNQSAPVISSAGSMNFGTAYTATANTGIGALTWALGPGSTAAGAAIDANTGAVSVTGTGTVVIRATFAGDSNYNPATSASFTLTVAPADGVTFTLNATSFTYTGSPQGPTVMPSPANATFTTGGTTTATNVGSYIATASANGNFSGSNSNLNWSIVKANQSTPVINSAAVTAVGASYTATANAGFGATTWALGTGSTATGAAINATTGVVTFSSTGTVVIKATYAGNSNYHPATSADFTITVLNSMLYWDGSGTPAASGVTAFNPNTNWSTSPAATTPDPAAIPGVNDTAVFGLGTPMLVGLNGARTVGALIFSGTGNTTLYAHPSSNTSNTLTIGAGGLTINSGAGAVSTVSNSTNGFLSYRLNGDQSWINNSANLLTMNGGISNTANTTPFTLTLGGAGAGGITLASAVSNGGTTGTTSLVVNTSGAGAITLNGTNTYTGATAVFAGTLKLGADRSLGFGGVQTTSTAGTIVAAGATLDLNGRTVNEPLTLSGAGFGGIGALINSAGTTATIGSGIAGISYSALGSVGPLPTIAITGTGTGATAVVTGSLTAASINLNSGTTVYSVAPSVTISGGGGSGATATATLSSGIVTAINLTNVGAGYSTAPTITFGTGTVTTAGTNPTASVNVNNFTPMGVQLTAAGADYTGTPTYTFSGGSGTYTPGALTLSSVTLAADATIGGSGNLTLNAAIGESTTGRALTKIGSGTLTLMGANTYTGATTITAGALSGSGSVAGGVSVGASAALTPGTTAGTGVFSAQSFNLGGTTTLRVNGTVRGTGHDALIASGQLTYGGALVLQLPTLVLNDGDSFQLFQAGAQSGAFASVSITASGTATANLTSTGFSGTINGKPYTFAYATGVLRVSTPVTFALSATSFAYTGADHIPTVSATPANATFTTGGTLSASDVGTYTATASATGDFTGADNNLTWSIVKAEQTAPVISSWNSTTFDAGYTATANTGFGALSWSLGTGSTAAGAAIDAATGAVDFTSVGTVVIRASFAGDASRNAATSADFTVTINPASTGFTLDSTSIPYNGSAQGPTILPTVTNATFVAGGTTSATDLGTYTATASATGNYTGSDNNLTWSIVKGTPELSWLDPAPITYGTALSSTQLNASAGAIAGTFTYDPAPGAVLNVGAQTLSVTFHPTDAANYNSATATVALTVNPATASVTLSNLSATFDGNAKPVGVTTTPSGLATVVTYNGSSVPPSAVGSYAVVATVSDANYLGSATGTLQIGTPFQNWAANYFNGTQLLDPAISGPNADPDGDGLVNLLEYALDEDPTTPTDAQPAASLSVDSKLQLTFFRARAELTYEVLGTSDLATWTVLATNPGAVGESVTVTDGTTLAASVRRFLRLRVTKP